MTEFQKNIYSQNSRFLQPDKTGLPLSILNHKNMDLKLMMFDVHSLDITYVYLPPCPGQYMQWVDRYQAQLVVLAAQIAWSNGVDTALQTLATQSPPHDFTPLQRELRVVEATLNVLADSVLQEQPPVRRKKLEHLVSGEEKGGWI